MDEAIKKSILSAAREIMLNQPLCPMLFLSKKGGIVAIIPLVLFAEKLKKEGLLKNLSEREKNRLVLRYIGNLLRKGGIKFDSIYVVQEGWMLKADALRSKEEFLKCLEKGIIKDHPKKVEVLALLYSEGIGKHQAEAIPFFKTPDGPVFEEPISSKIFEVQSILLDNFWNGYGG